MNVEKDIINNLKVEEFVEYMRNELAIALNDLKKSVDEQNIAYTGKAYSEILRLKNITSSYYDQKLANLQKR